MAGNRKKMENSRLSFLYHRQTKNENSKAEQAELFSLLADEENQQEAEALMATSWNHFTPTKEVFNTQQSGELLAKIVSANDCTAPVIPIHSQKSRSRQSWAAAVLLVGICATFGYVYFAKNRQPTTVSAAVTAPVNDALPAGNKATLTLSNGQVIILDTVANGAVATQNNIQVIKQANGQLEYIVSGVPSTQMLFNTMTTPRGGKYELLLPDGTHVWLNAASSITYPMAFAGTERRVKLNGEAYFEVAHNADMPFKVEMTNDKSEHGVVEVLGTHFNIHNYEDEDETTTTLLEGSVKIYPPTTRFNRQIMLEPGYQVVLKKPHVKAGYMNMRHADIDKVMAWKNGLFNFEEASLEEVMRQLQRWYDIEVIYKSDIPNIHFFGKMSRNLKLSDVLKALKSSGVNFTIEGKKLIVQP